MPKDLYQLTVWGYSESTRLAPLLCLAEEILFVDGSISPVLATLMGSEPGLAALRLAPQNTSSYNTLFRQNGDLHWRPSLQPKSAKPSPAQLPLPDPTFLAARVHSFLQPHLASPLLVALSEDIDEAAQDLLIHQNLLTPAQSQWLESHHLNLGQLRRGEFPVFLHAEISQRFFIAWNQQLGAPYFLADNSVSQMVASVEDSLGIPFDDIRFI